MIDQVDEACRLKAMENRLCNLYTLVGCACKEEGEVYKLETISLVCAYVKTCGAWCTGIFKLSLSTAVAILEILHQPTPLLEMKILSLPYWTLCHCYMTCCLISLSIV